ncbi:hypothetical protein HY416_00105 [Candidatus Kaiserbacteria bacterium]|nr:hypothetical protein [Candidatus Kaiserbacteria bacterium]
MTAPLITVLISGGCTLLLLTLFRAERRRGMRYASGVRVLFDRSLEDAQIRWKDAYRRLMGHTVRQSVRYLFHRILTSLLRRLGRLEAFLWSAVHINRRRANRAEESPSSHFSAIAEHKRETELSEEERQQKRDEALNGK